MHWHPHELARLSGVSVRTLHHYDRIGLLKPMIREDNKYRIYSETDLFRLQQIIALKFFGFQLSHIKLLIDEKSDVVGNFRAQQQLLLKKAQTLLQASSSLESIIAECQPNNAVPWETITKSIEVYRMTQKIENAWVAQVLSNDELKEYARFEEQLKKNTSSEVQQQFEDKWAQIINIVSKHLNDDPEGEIGIGLAEQFMNWVNALYGAEFARLRTSIWEKGFKSGHGTNHGITMEIVNWIDRAIDAYWRKRIYALLARVNLESEESMLASWKSLLTEMHGNDEARNQELLEAALKDSAVSEDAKKWLRKIS
jgi:DNA-binding transcriptional MerR regulator